MRIRSHNIAWLGILGVLILLVFLSGAASPQVLAALLAIYAIAAAGSLIEVQPARWRETMQSSPLTRMRMSPEAREASDRARRRSSGLPTDLTLLDIGLISTQGTVDGMVMRKGRSISGDDDGVRPFITLHVQPGQADRNALIRYEIVDNNGQVRYVHEMKTYLRDGEMHILADHQLPLGANADLNGMGDWDLRVTIDGAMAGILSFTVTPSLRQRERLIASRHQRLSDEAPATPRQDMTVSLEDLLRGGKE